jgi:hypothetical protein
VCENHGDTMGLTDRLLIVKADCNRQDWKERARFGDEGYRGE